MDRSQIIKLLKAQINLKQHIVGVATGSGMTAKYTVMGGADFILALSAGKFRQMGRSSMASYLCYANSNEVVMDFACKELLPLKKDIPVIFGLDANDPTIHLYEYLEKIKAWGFVGINNFPSIGLIDGQFKEALEEEGITFDREVEAIRLANFLDLFTVAFVFNEEQAKKMIEAKADVICAHFGFTIGGMLGAKKSFSIEHAKLMADRIFTACNNADYEPIKMVYGGPAGTLIDMQYLYDNTECMGYIGGSAIERIPAEQAIMQTTKAFKSGHGDGQSELMLKMLDRSRKNYDYVAFLKTYIHERYSNDIHLKDLALLAHVSYTYLSTLFKKEVGCSFTEYLVKYRINKAAEIMVEEKIPLVDVAMLVGYRDYPQFSKMFKKYKGMAPKLYRSHNISTRNQSKLQD